MMLTEQATSERVYVEPDYELVPANHGKRLANYVIDLVFFYMILLFWGIITALVAPDALDALDVSETDSSMITDRLIGLLLYGLIMSLIEAIFRGKSIGKLITGTKAVNADGTPISFGRAFLRGFTRAVPFNALSAFGRPCHPWHDQWTNTLVIDEKQTGLHNEQLKYAALQDVAAQ